MSPLNRGPLLGARMPPAAMRSLPPPRFRARAVLPRVTLVPPGMPPRMPPPPMNPAFGPIRLRLPPLRPVGVSRPNGLLPLFPPRTRGYQGAPGAPMIPPMGSRGSGVPRGPLIRPWPRIPPPQMMPPMRPRFGVRNGQIKGKPMNNVKKVNKLEELELKKPWMTNEIRSEIQKKNKLYAKAKKSQDAVEWKEFKDLRNKVTRMIRDAKNEYLLEHPEQDGHKTDDKNTVKSEGIQKTENTTESEMEQTEKTEPSNEKAHLYPGDEEPYDQRDENYVSSEDDTAYYCEICDKDFSSEDTFSEHKSTHKVCNIDGCTFSAHPLLVEKHIKMQHNTGLYQKIKNLSTPEDIEKWIMERKRKYPTKANIELRKAEQEEKIQRGEIIQKCDIRTKIKKSTNVCDKKPKCDNKRKFRKRREYAINNPFHKNELYRGLCPFPGTSILKENLSNGCLDNQTEQTKSCEEIIDNISDEDDVSHASVEIKSSHLCIPSLVANYESETEEDDAPEEIPIKKIKMEYCQINEKTVESITTSEETSNNNQQLSVDANHKFNKQPIKFDKTSRDCEAKDKEIRKTNRIVRNNVNEKFLHKYHNGLLEKLLSRSIQHERNLICQCVKYIVDNNFFDLAYC